MGTGGSGEFEAKVEGELGGLRSAIKKSEETRLAEFERLDGELAALNKGWLQLEERVAEQEQRPVYSPPPAELPAEPTPPLPPVVKELPVVVVEQQTASGLADGEELMRKLEQRLASEVAGLSSQLAAPLSVAFDAVRTEDFVGQDGWLPFTKMNANLGDGMNMETGIFAAPVAGLYLFLLNVYGAPRDGVVLSIR